MYDKISDKIFQGINRGLIGNALEFLDTQSLSRMAQTSKKNKKIIYRTNLLAERIIKRCLTNKLILDGQHKTYTDFYIYVHKNLLRHLMDRIKEKGKINEPLPFSSKYWLEYPLNVAVRLNLELLVDWLLEKIKRERAEKNGQESKENKEYEDRKHNIELSSLLHAAVHSNNIKIANSLILAGAQLHDTILPSHCCVFAGPRIRNSALSLAATNGHEDMVIFLLKVGCNSKFVYIEVEKQAKSYIVTKREIPFLTAVRKNNYYCAKILLQENPNLMVDSDRNWSIFNLIEAEESGPFFSNERTTIIKLATYLDPGAGVLLLFALIKKIFQRNLAKPKKLELADFYLKKFLFHGEEKLKFHLFNDTLLEILQD